MDEDGLFLDDCKGNLQLKVAELQEELNEIRIISQNRKQLCTELSQENKELENKLQEYNDETKKLKEKMIEDGCLWDSCKKNLQNKLNEMGMLWKEHEKLCTTLKEEKNVLENKLQEYDDETKELKKKMLQDGCMWNSCKAKLEDTVTFLQNELVETQMLRKELEELCTQLKQEKVELENKLIEYSEEIHELKEQMTEDVCLWDSCKEILQGRVATLENQLIETRMLNQRYEEWCIRVREEKIDMENNLRNELKETRLLSLRDKELCAQLRQEKAEDENKLEKCTDGNKKLLAKKTEDENLWDTACKVNFESAVAGLQDESNKKTNLCQENEELCTQLRNKNNDLEMKLKEVDDASKRLQEKMTEDGCLWDTPNANFQEKLTCVEYEARILRQEHEDLRTHFREEEKEFHNMLKECIEGTRKLHAKMTEDGCLWNTCKQNLEETVAGLRNDLELMTNEGRILCQKYEEMCIECEFLKAQLGDENDTNERAQSTEKFEEVVSQNKYLKKKMENYSQRPSLLVEQEKKSVISMSERSDKLVQDLVRENSSVKQEMNELQNKLDMWINETKQYKKMLNSVEGLKMAEDLVTKNTTVKKEVPRLNQQNQKLRKDMICNKKTLLQTQFGIVGRLNAENDRLKNEIADLRRSFEEMVEINDKVVEENGALKVKLKGGEQSGVRDSYCNSQSKEEREVFHGNLKTFIPLADTKLALRKCLDSVKNIVLPSNSLISGCHYGWCGGIV
ncbi:hypothetical protein KI387_028563 [Taxus chinensis]|uniref:Uncharacterized protein n=1 Tax=Taxus chinensis TaxID=29808 RepID=A0AA38CCQ7_TAXCH|nr:hypothetical protein KI387_028563 [Taxus chinensis]